jgi:multidrug resistance efflux pump
MIKSKALTGVLIALAIFGAPRAFAEARFDGTVIAGETTTVFAPYGGTVKSLGLREGQQINEGDELAVIGTTKVFAPESGTVRGLFAEAGDSITASDAVMYSSPVSQYTIQASIDKAHSSAAAKYVRIGERVYMKCSKDGTHRAVGIITSAAGSGYTVEATGGELYLEETIYIYRNSSYANTSLIGSGTVQRTGEIAVTGAGGLLRVHVRDGEEVERGQLLFETVDGDIDALTVADGGVISPAGGVIAEIKAIAGARIAKNGPLLTIYPRESSQIEISIPEDMLSEISEGDAVKVFFDWYVSGDREYAGTIESISYMKTVSNSSQRPNGAPADNTAGEAEFKAYITFEAGANIRLGMAASVVLP